MTYLIYSVNHSKGECVWWRPNCCGYTRDVGLAGRYNEAKAKEICTNHECVAVPESALVRFEKTTIIDLGWGDNRSQMDAIMGKLN